MDGFVTAVSTKTGRKQRIPAAWLEKGHVFAKDWRRPPSHTKQAAAAVPTDDAAPDHGVDATPTSAKPGDTETPAAGGEQEI